MRLHGTIEDNLASALRSARRLSKQPVHGDTLKHWQDLLGHARQAIATGRGEAASIEPLAVQLETEIANRQS
jgi:hypothetical protein